MGQKALGKGGKMIRTIIVDDELLAGAGVRSLIEGRDDIVVSGVFEMPVEAVAFLRENMVDVVVTDIEMAEMSGLEFIRIIREEHLADGIIILSCHDEFSYAQEAIERGTDSYLLKHHVSADMLTAEIHKVYEKNRYNGNARAPGVKREKEITGREVYTVGALRILPGEPDGGQVERTMLMHVLERIVARYEMGTVFSPLNREMFIIFQDDKNRDGTERKALLHSNISVIERAVQQYMDGRIIFGLSGEFEDLKQVHEKYQEALLAVEMNFYRPRKTIFCYRRTSADFTPWVFSTAHFLEEEGIGIFQRELDACLERAGHSQLSVQDLQGHLLQAVTKMIYQILNEHPFSEVLTRRWSLDVMLPAAITQERDAPGLKEKLAGVMENFRSECLAELKEDALFQVFEYIDRHLEEKLSLVDLAQIACMSVPTFSKKFKEQTDMTLVQYLNGRRIERAKFLLKNKEHSLETVAEKSGFSNANYLVRVFKKVTGQTVSEYRK